MYTFIYDCVRREYLLGSGGKPVMDWINLAQDGDRIGGVVDTVMNLRVS